MGHARAMEKDIFADVIEKIQSLTESQQRFLQEMLAGREKVTAVSKKKLLRKSFGVWADRTDIKDSIEYVDEMRKGWESRLPSFFFPASAGQRFMQGSGREKRRS